MELTPSLRPHWWCGRLRPRGLAGSRNSAPRASGTTKPRFFVSIPVFCPRLFGFSVERWVLNIPDRARPHSQSGLVSKSRPGPQSNSRRKKKKKKGKKEKRKKRRWRTRTFSLATIKHMARPLDYPSSCLQLTCGNLKAINDMANLTF